MAYVIKSKSLCFIHLPRSWGSWTKRVLTQIEPGTRDGSITHGLPTHYGYGKIFVNYRDPAEWLASVFVHRIKTFWEVFPTPVPWKDFCALIECCKDTRFEPFAEKVATLRPGVITWLYRAYTPPGTKIVKCGSELKQLLHSYGCEVSAPAYNSGIKVPEPSPEVRKMLAESEPDLLEYLRTQ